MDIKDIKYGLIVIDPTEPDENGQFEVLHFCGYAEEPNEDAEAHLREELTKDEEFGLTERIDRCIIINADPDTVEYFRSVAEGDSDD